MAVREGGTVDSSAPPGFGYRWTILSLLFFATTINYVDRGVIGLLAPTLQTELHWSEQDYASTAQWFTFAYAIGFLGAGRFLDWIGVKKGYAAALIWWSLAAMSTAFATTLGGFYAARAALGLGESGNFPGAIKATAEWFPKKERSFATGIFNAGSNVGAVVTPMIVPFIALNWGWRWAFVFTGALGFVWLLVWALVYRTPELHPKLSAAELAYIRSDPIERTTPVSYFGILFHRQTWAFILGKMITDPVWWFYLFWLPKFLDTRFQVKLGNIAAPIIVIYVIADLGSVGGGWLSSFLIKRGASVNKGRKLTMLLAALVIVPTMLAPRAPTLWTAVAIVSIAAAAHQWWSCNLFTLPSDMFPRRAVATVVGLGGFAGAMGGVGFQKLTGMILQKNPTAYGEIFMFCGLAYVTALAIIHLLVPTMEPVRLDGEAG
jgi:ACS family hexuronate transporter-like MFS transporter